MGTEIERKFLVINDNFKTDEGIDYQQGYLNRSPERTVRIRTAGDKAFITIKGKSVGAKRPEFEYEIPLSDAKEMLAMCEGPIIEKTRYICIHEGMKWEIDVFHGENEGLVIAEIELKSEEQEFSKPSWVGKEVTMEPRYYNSSLSAKPFSSWGIVR